MAGTADLIGAYADLAAARPAYAKAESYYNGDVDEIYASDAIARLLAKSNLDEIDELNFARIPVRAVLNKLHITSIATGDSDADAEIANLTKRNQLDMEARGLHEKGCSLGDAYLMVWPQTDIDGTVTDIDMFVHGPTTVRVIYGDENPLSKKLAIKSWRTGSGKTQKTRADLYYPATAERQARIERFVWSGKWSGKGDRWQPYTEDGQDSVLPNAYGEIPFFHYRTGRPYGRPEHYGAYGAQALINKTVVSHAAVMDYESLPQRYGLIDPAVDQSGQQSDFDPDFPEDAAADPEGRSNPSQLRNDPGEFWQLQGYKGVGQFDAADPDTYLKPLDRYVKAMSQVTETPFHLFDSTGDQMSGVSRREATAPLLARVEELQRSFGGAWCDAWEFALRLLGYDDVTVQVRWKPAEQVSDAEGWATVAAKVDAGMPREQALIEAGCDPVQVKAWLAALDDDAELGRRVGLLTSLGAAVQSLGSGVQLGAITSEQVTRLLDSVLGATATLNKPEAAG